MMKVTAAILVQDNRVFIARRKKGEQLSGFWEFPGGKVEDGETMQECLKREMREEFQVDITVGDFFTESHYNYHHGPIHLLAYWAQWKQGAFIPSSHDQCCWVEINELDKYDFSPADRPLVKKLQEALG